MLSALDHKLLRDLWRIKGQAAAIALVVAVGVLLLVMMSGMLNSLEETRRTYYERYRLADVFAPAVGAPEQVLERLRAVPGVAAAEGRVTGAALLDMAGQDLPVRARAISLPALGAPRLNAIYLTDGRMFTPGRTGEVVLLKGFAEAHGLRLGDHLRATMNGARRDFTIVGMAQAPEFLFTTAPGEIVPDDARFAVIWMNREALSAALDVQGAFNEALIALDRGARLAPVLAAVDRILDPHGGLGAYGLKDQISDRFLTEEIRGLRVSSSVVPPIFMAVAAFLLYIVIARLVQAEREQIGLVKAFGYSDWEVALHYFKMVLAIAVFGALLGCALGIWAGRAMAGVYQDFYKFPFLIFRVDPASFVTGVLVSVLAASAGALWVLRGVFRLTPAVAMRPPAPADFSRTGALNERLKGWLDQPSRMVIRRILRNPGRIAGAVVGIAVGMGLSSAQLSLLSGFDRTLDLTFGVIDRSDVSVTFVQPMPSGSVHALRQLPGVIEVEPVRTIGVTLRNGAQNYRGAINGLVTQPRLNRAVTSQMDTIAMPREGVVLARALADILQVKAGDVVQLDVLEGRRPTLEVPVTRIAETLLGAPAFMHMDTLNRALREPGRVSGAYLRVDGARIPEVFAVLKSMPTVAGVARREDARAAMQTLMDTGAGMMRYVMAAIAGIITFGIVYNAARISFGEQARDLASLRVIGFSTGETAFVLLGELAIVVLLALPLGVGIGHYLSFLIAAGFSTDIYQIPTRFRPDAFGTAALAVIVAAIVSGLLVKRDINRVDLVATLKTRE
ncbi:putative ABC transport system permease protein [Salinihabitans flavidus]|uniref:Putative ABC transport system permease protein n=1 Tax=Salinihabitans flavidus TaxID=569882 RepID=A0A1H8P367_9RHOB|nr:ABC transporter permease [Salinihabitans flavidus]SEO36234.1 putative ABC transport system permease protein [Salinihabitans flavidus]